MGSSAWAHSFCKTSPVFLALLCLVVLVVLAPALYLILTSPTARPPTTGLIVFNSAMGDALTTTKHRWHSPLSPAAVAFFSRPPPPQVLLRVVPRVVPPPPRHFRVVATIHVLLSILLRLITVMLVFLFVRLPR